MHSRSNSFNIPAYLLIGIAGAMFILVPPTSVSAFYIHYNIYFIEVFGAFFAIGGFTSLLSIIARKWFKIGVVPTWYFEMAGLFLIISASTIYSYSLCNRGIQTGDLNVFALGVLFVGVSFEMIGKLIETNSYVKWYKISERAKDVH